MRGGGPCQKARKSPSLLRGFLSLPESTKKPQEARGFRRSPAAFLEGLLPLSSPPSRAASQGEP
eukprot:9495120-Pyramimonas_sp.AAC.1